MNFIFALLLIIAAFSPVILLVIIMAKIEQSRLGMIKNEPGFFMCRILILLTKLNIIKWKRRLFIENIIVDGDCKYTTKIGKKEYRVLKTSMVFPSGTYLDVYKEGYKKKYCVDGFVRRYEKAYKLYNFLENTECEEWIPSNVINDPSRWVKGKEYLARRVKLKRILQDD